MRTFSVGQCAHWIDFVEEVVIAANRVEGNIVCPSWVVDNVLPDGDWHLGWKRGAFDVIDVEVFTDRVKEVIYASDDTTVPFTFETDVRWVIIPCDDPYGTID